MVDFLGAKETATTGADFPFGSKEARAQRDQDNGDAKALINGTGAKTMESSKDTNFGYKSKKGKSFSH